MILHDFLKKKQKAEKITMVTCYDYTFARILGTTSVDSILVGDSLASVIYGYPNTLSATINIMAQHIQAVAKGCPEKFIVGDLPFMSFRKGLTSNMTAVETLLRAGANAVKLEGSHGNLKLINHIVESGVPVMGHLGLTPQMINILGGHKVQGKKEKEQELIRQQAKELEDAGCFALVLECVPSDLAQKITADLRIPTIGIGAGVHCDGQILVLQDLLGMNLEFQPRFLRKYLEGAKLIQEALESYCRDARDQSFPSEKESYSR